MKKIIVSLMFSLLLCSAAFAQKAKPIIFAVVNEGKQIEPIAYIENGKLTGVGDDAVTSENMPDFVKNYYKKGAKYNLIFGGDNVGTATVTKDLSKTDCAANQAEISLQAGDYKPREFVMALATSAGTKNNVKGTRKLPTSAERAEVEKLVMEKMLARNVPIKNTGELRYHNLTKVDVDNDGNPEFVGTYWYNTGDKKRTLMFFIADKKAKGDVSITFEKFDDVEEKDVMNEDITTLDSGTYHELLIDMFDTDADGTAEIFTVVNAFEGSTFKAYKRTDGKWTRVLETANYHCAF